MSGAVVPLDPPLCTPMRISQKLLLQRFDFTITTLGGEGLSLPMQQAYNAYKNNFVSF